MKNLSILLAAALPLSTTAALAADGVGEAVAVIDSATVSGQIGDRTLTIGTAVYVGDLVKTDGIGEAQLLFADGTRMVVGPNSSLIIEEFLFRGLLHRAFSGFPYSSVLFLVVSPLLFALVHWEDGLANLASTYIVGVFMAIAYLGFRNLWPLVIGHIFTDLVWFG